METTLDERITRISKYLSVALILIGGIALCGWIFDVGILKSIFPSMVAMKANTAASFILIGVATGSYHWLDQKSVWRRVIINTAAGIVFSIALLTFIEYLFGYDFGIDQFLFTESADAIFTSAPGRMAFNTAINFVLTGIALFLLDAKTAIRDRFIQLLGMPVFFLASFSLIGYTYRANPLVIGLDFSTAMALHTTIGFVFVGLLLIFSTKKGLMEVVLSPNIGGRVIRLFLPIAVLIPILLGGLNVFITHRALINPELGVAIMAVGNIIFLSITIYLLSVHIFNESVKNEKVTKMLKENEERYLSDLQSQLKGTQKMNSMMINRELRMTELKNKIKELETKQNKK